MKKLKTIMAACAACALTSTAMAAADGKIEFTGEIISGSCTVTGAGSGNSVPVDLGRVLMSIITDAGAGNKVASVPITMNLDCSNSSTGLQTVKFKFDPTSGGSGVDTNNNSLLKTTGTATGVGIGLYDGSNQLINLSAAGQEYSAALTAAAGGTGGNNKYTATMNMSASYVGNGATLAVGAANGTLPFTLTYD